METRNNIPLGTKLSSDDLLATFCDIFGQDGQLLKEMFPVFEVGQNLIFTIEVDNDWTGEAPEGGILDKAYHITVKNEPDEIIMVVYMKPTDNPLVVTFAWDIFDEQLNDELGGRNPVQFTL